MFKSNNQELKKLALELYPIYELMELEDLNSIEKVCEVLDYDFNDVAKKFDSIWAIDTTAAYVYLLGIIREALNARTPFSGKYYIPDVRIRPTDNVCDAELSINGIMYAIDCGEPRIAKETAFNNMVYNAWNIRCHSAEVARHMARYFKMYIINAVYGNYKDI